MDINTATTNEEDCPLNRLMSHSTSLDQRDPPLVTLMPITLTVVGQPGQEVDDKVMDVPFLISSTSIPEWTEKDSESIRLPIAACNVLKEPTIRYNEVLRRVSDLVCKYADSVRQEGSPPLQPQDEQLLAMQTRYNNWLAQFTDNLDRNIWYASFATDGLMKIEKEMKELGGCDDGAANADDRDSGDKVVCPCLRKSVEWDFKTVVYHFHDFRKTESALQMLYWMLTRPTVCTNPDCSSHLTPKTDDLISAIVREMEPHQKLLCANIESAKSAFENCLDWMIRERKIGLQFPDGEAEMEEYKDWLMNPDGDCDCIHSTDVTDEEEEMEGEGEEIEDGEQDLAKSEQ